MKELQIIYNQEVLGKNFHVYGTVEEPLFLAKEVASWIDYNKDSRGFYNVSQMLETIDSDEKVKMYCKIVGMSNSCKPVNSTLLDGVSKTHKPVISIGPANRLFLTEAGLYEVLFQSRKPIAKQFKKQVKAILKEIRINGGYINERATPQQLEQLQQKIDTLTNYKIKGYTINDVCSATGLRRKDIKEYLFDNEWVEEYNGEISTYDGRYIYIKRRKDVHFTAKGLDKILKALQPPKPKRQLINKELYRK